MLTSNRRSGSRKSKNRGRSTSNLGGSQRSEINRLLETRNVKYSLGRKLVWTQLMGPQVISIPASQQFYTMSSGALASNLALDVTARVDNWATRWGAVFEQYVVTGIEVYAEISKVGSAQGSAWFRVVEDPNAPSSTMTRQEHSELELTAVSDDKARCVMALWKPASAEDWTWNAVSSSHTCSWVKVFSSPASTGTDSGDSTTRIAVQVIFKVAFRYLV